MKLERLKLQKGTKSKSKRLGRGYGSGKGGHTVGRGAKGQKARSKVSLGFEGGQVPLYKRIPQIGGFVNPTKKKTVSVSLSKFNIFKAGSVVRPKDLVAKKIIKKVPRHGVKILANGDLDKKLTLKGFLVSEAAKAKIEKASATLS